MESISELYGSEAEAYWAISNDRDFESQTRAIVDQLGCEPRNAVEAFAGPAYHASRLARMHPRCSLICVDTSVQMKDIACRLEGLDAGQYRVGDIVDSLHRHVAPNSLDLFLALRYSIGYLEPDGCDSLMQGIDRTLRPGGLAVFELHRPGLLAEGLQRLSIRERRMNTPSGQVGCIWPDGNLSWSDTDWVVRMPVTVKWYDTDGRVARQRQFVSSERIFTAGELERAARRVGGFKAESACSRLAESFPESMLLLLRK